MNKWIANAVAAALLLPGVPVAAQVGNGLDGVLFIEALRSGDDGKAVELLATNKTIVNSRDPKGDTPLIVVIGERNERWTGHLLTNGADPNMAARNGDTPLIAASRIGFATAVEWLLDMGAKVDAANKMGETALIVAVQQRQMPVVKELLAKGANPDKADSAAGYSARDYAKRDTRNPQLLRLIEAATPAAR